MDSNALVLDGVGLAGKNEGFAHDVRVGYLKKFGVHSQSFTTLQPDLSYFDVPGVGYIAHTRKWGISIVFSDPVCSAAHFEQIIEMFLEKHPGAMFVQVSKAVVEILNRKYQYRGTQMGSEAKVYLADWSISGSSKKSIRQAVNQAKEQGIEIREGKIDALSSIISEKWIKTRACKKEIRFLIRPMDMTYRENVRYFYAYRNGVAVGFIWFDPIYRDGKLVGYIPNISRGCPEFKQGIWYAIMIAAMEMFKKEGLEYVDLGLIPLSLMKEREDHESPALRWVLGKIYEYGNFLYNFKGLEFTKARFKGEYSRTYVAHANAMPILSLLATFRMTRLI